MTEIWYTARKKFNAMHPGVSGWQEYVEWARLPQLVEVVGLDNNLNALSFECDHSEAEVYNYLVIEEGYSTNLFNSESYVRKCVGSIQPYNFLAVVKNPETDCSSLDVEGFKFLGYELLGKYYDISALTNCGGFDETFLPEELNIYGLIENYERAFEVRKQLFINNPEEDHADCHVFGIWRHSTIG